MNYAEGTSVAVDRSKSELDRLLSKHGATQQGMMADNEKGTAVVVFKLKGRHIQMPVPLPRIGDFAKHPDPRTRKPRTQDQQHRAWEQACRERWRAIVLLVKAKLEAVRIGTTTIEKEFLCDTLLPNGKTVYEQIHADVEKAYLTGEMQSLPLLGPAQH
jgi:hypothetical protein